MNSSLCYKLKPSPKYTKLTAFMGKAAKLLKGIDRANAPKTFKQLADQTTAMNVKKAATVVSNIKGKIALTKGLEDHYTNNGVVITSGDGTARIIGVYGAMVGELVNIGYHARGIAFNLGNNYIDVTLVDKDRLVLPGQLVTRTNKLVTVPVGFGVLGRIINGVGDFVDGKDSTTTTRKGVDVKAPGIIARQPVKEAVQTGIMAIDSLTPIGRGQRELIIGNRQSGKSTLAATVLLHQRYTALKLKSRVYNVYVAVGQKKAAVARLIARLKRGKVWNQTTVVVS
jgi:F0F1-type ATP synthase alpha subunit